MEEKTFEKNTIQEAEPLAVQVSRVSKSFPRNGGRLEVLCDISLSVPAGSFVSVVGPSGSGKSTLLSILAGLEEPDEGTVRLVEKDGAAIDNRLGRVGFMPQRDLLLPWRSALDNATTALEVRGMKKAEAREMVLPLFEQFGLGGFAANYPHELSGGMRQRVSFLRSAVGTRGLMLLDEPFGALDALTRAAMQEWLLGAAPKLGATFVLVTHDADEAVLLSDRVYVLSPRPGRVVGIVDIEFPGPRSLESAADPRFGEYRARVLESLRAAGGLGTAGTGRSA